MRKLAAVAVLVLSAAAVAVASDPITIGETIKIRSKIMGEERTILVSVPADYERSQERYPVLYMTDGDAHLTHTRGTVDFLVRNGLMPDLIIVGVSNTDRTRDLTPTHAFRTREDGTREEIAHSGGGARFVDFFAQELIPYVERHYRTEPYRILAGHSYGGLFSLYALASRPDLFNAFIAASPSLNFDEDYILRTYEAFLTGRKELRRTLFVTMANEEAGEPSPTRLERFHNILSGTAPAGFAWDARLLADEDHGSVVLRSHYWGLRSIFVGWRLPAGPEGRSFNGTVDDIKSHYAELSERFGFIVRPAELTVNQAGYRALGQDDFERALAIFRYNVELYPASANVHDSLGEGLERAGRLEEAHASYAKAVENAAKIGDQRIDIFTRNRDRAATALKEKKTE